MSERMMVTGFDGGPFSILVHGGAGDVDPARRSLHIDGCRAAALAGRQVLREGGSALDAVLRAVRVLEDDPLFNAGTGGSLNEHGVVEHDASIMEGRELRAGAVCALRGFAQPIAIARAVLQDGVHVLYAAEGAAAFAKASGFEPVPSDALITAAARATLARVQAGQGTGHWAGNTVGAVARDPSGLTAAATSTGGTVNKRAGRVGDSPLIGAGTYADDEAGAASTTGAGEPMIRLGVARLSIEAMREGATAIEAARRAMDRLLDRLGATGGIITVDRQGRLGLARTTATMSWAAAIGDVDHAGV